MKRSILKTTWLASSRSFKAICCTGLAVTLLCMQAEAQNATYHYYSLDNRSIDYVPSNNQYANLGASAPFVINGMSNASNIPGYNLNRPQLHIVDAYSLQTQWSKIYCTQDEVQAVQDGDCAGLSVDFNPQEARLTQDQGYIICGNVRRDRETSNCPASSFSNAFLLKVDASGNVQWFKRYDNELFFYSVIEDATTGNFIVAGVADYNKSNSQGFIMGTDATGTPLWSYIASSPMANGFCQYLNVESYQNGGITQYAVIGNTHIPSGTGATINMILALVDANGAVTTSTSLGNSTSPVVLGRDVHDAHDGDIVITGDGYAWGVSVLKINPVSLNISFWNQYDLPNNNLATFAIERAFAGGDIIVTGEKLTNRNAYVLKLDAMGNMNSFWRSDYNVRGVDITFNSASGHMACSGIYSAQGDSYIEQDKYPNYCGIPEMPTTTAMANADVTPILFSSRPVTEIPDNAVAFTIGVNEEFKCGSLKPAPSDVKKLSANDKLILSPNPATSSLLVQLPATATNVRLKVMDVMGKVVLSQQVTDAADVQLDISSLHTGVYNLVMECDGQIQQSRFVKQ